MLHWYLHWCYILYFQCIIKNILWNQINPSLGWYLFKIYTFVPYLHLKDAYNYLKSIKCSKCPPFEEVTHQRQLLYLYFWECTPKDKSRALLLETPVWNSFCTVLGHHSMSNEDQNQFRISKSLLCFDPLVLKEQTYFHWTYFCIKRMSLCEEEHSRH